jgi:hypothetical protein
MLAGMAGKLLPKRKDFRMTKGKLLSWLMPMVLGLALFAPQSALSQGCG